MNPIDHEFENACDYADMVLEWCRKNCPHGKSVDGELKDGCEQPCEEFIAREDVE